MPRPSAKYLRGKRIDPKPITGKETVADLLDDAFLAYNAGRLREGCLLFTQRMLAPEVTVGMSLTGAMTPAVIVFTIPETKPCSEAAMPRRVGKRSSVVREMVGIAMAEPIA